MFLKLFSLLTLNLKNLLNEKKAFLVKSKINLFLWNSEDSSVLAEMGRLVTPLESQYDYQRWQFQSSNCQPCLCGCGTLCQYLCEMSYYKASLRQLERLNDHWL